MGVLGECSSVNAERVIVFGASNVVRGLSSLVSTLVDYHQRVPEVLVAAGHGRSYGRYSRVLWRGLPGLTQCPIWEALAERPSIDRVSVLVTDVGNDLIYGCETAQILDWVRDCLSRAEAPQVRRIVTELPMGSIRRLGRGRFLAARTLLFPWSQLAFEGLIDRCERLNEGLRSLAREFSATLVAPGDDWYGIDPIHVRWRRQRVAWRAVLADWRETEKVTGNCLPFADWRRVNKARHAEREWFGVRQHRPQPSAILSNGASLSLF